MRIVSCYSPWLPEYCLSFNVRKIAYVISPRGRRPHRIKRCYISCASAVRRCATCPAAGRRGRRQSAGHQFLKAGIPPRAEHPAQRVGCAPARRLALLRLCSAQVAQPPRISGAGKKREDKSKSIIQTPVFAALRRVAAVRGRSTRPSRRAASSVAGAAMEDKSHRHSL